VSRRASKLINSRPGDHVAAFTYNQALLLLLTSHPLTLQHVLSLALSLSLSLWRARAEATVGCWPWLGAPLSGIVPSARVGGRGGGRERARERTSERE
jgi:hypothetical protein